jgi:hypothetical protein
MRYFKIFHRGISDFISADDLEQAYDMAVAAYGYSFKIVECDGQETENF